MKPWKLFWVLALAAAGPLEGQATGQIAGIVKNSDGQPTASATVMVRGTRMSTVTGPDGRYTLSTVECLGSCGTAPVVMVNETYHEDMSPERLDALLESLSK